MASFSIASVAATCASVSSRALSSATELAEASNGGEPLLPEVGTWLQHISADAASLQELLPKCSAVSTEVQADLPRALRMCERALAVMDKQLSRLRSIDDAKCSIDDDVVSGYARYLELQAQVFTAYKSIVQT